MAYEHGSPELPAQSRDADAEQSERERELMAQLKESERERQRLVREIERIESLCGDWKREAVQARRECDHFRKQRSYLENLHGAERKGATQRSEELLRLHQQLEAARAREATLEAHLREEREAHQQTDERLTRALGELAALRRDEGKTYVSGPEGRPQNYDLVQEYRRLKDQHFHAVCAWALDSARQRGDGVPSDQRKGTIAHLKHLLSRLLLGTDFESPDPAERAMLAAPPAVAEIAARLTAQLRIATTTVELRRLRDQCTELCRRMLLASPPGQFDWPRIRSRFDSTQHEPTIDCEPMGVIELVVFPAYCANGVLFEKAVVRTVDPGDEGEVTALGATPVPREPAPWSPFWGKSGDGTYHPLAYHSLDVAAVGAVILERCPMLAVRMARAAEIVAEDLRGWLLFLLAAHDLGKFADGFQAKRPELMARLQGELREPGSPERHDTLGYWLWRKVLLPSWQGKPGLFERADEEWAADVLYPWLRPITGHHGRPPKEPPPGLPDLGRQFPAPVLAAAEGFVHELSALFLPAGLPICLFTQSGGAANRASWLVAGWATAADWIGSNEEWFPYCDQAMPLAKYWETIARPQAERAVAASGIAELLAGEEQGLRGLWPGMQPTPLQTLAEDLPLPDAPQLLILEEVTGGGKTEAAVLLAQRLMARRVASGLYFALPTMATANAMHGRVSTIFRQLFAEGAEPSLVLAHSRQQLYFALETTRRDRAYSRDETTASLDCAAWLADSRKKALLAQVGVGTIDQALLAVLPVKHQSLRLLGLGTKVLIVDEVHACDEYVLRLLERLLELHAALGGSVILLSATLAREQRRKLTAAFARGTGYGPPALGSAEYPLLTHLAAGRVEEHPLAARVEMRRRVEVRFHRQPVAVLAVLEERLAEGGCACWVRNTVDDAREAFMGACERFGRERVLLFHSRFTVFDRRRIEAEVLAAFGPKSSAAERRGRLLIATQVVEQSLDLDFDFMVSDLAPVDLLIQRAGRLRRHRRSLEGNCQQVDERGAPVLEVLAPEATEEPGEDWYAEMFPHGKWVYPDHGRLWLGARWLEEEGGFAMPEDARRLIEHVYGEASCDAIPPALRERTTRAEGESQAAKAMAAQNALQLDDGYKATELSWPEDAYTPTRLAEPTVMLCLLREVAGELVPWHQGEPCAWEQSEVQVRQSLVAAEDPRDEARFTALRLAQPRLRFLVLVVMREEDAAALGQALNLREEQVSVSYNVLEGLAVA